MMQKNDMVRVTVEAINNLGYGVGHLSSGQVVFIANAVTGDVVDARIIKVNKSYLIARIEAMIEASAMRCDDACPAAGCGGCIPYALFG